MSTNNYFRRISAVEYEPVVEIELPLRENGMNRMKMEMESKQNETKWNEINNDFEEVYDLVAAAEILSYFLQNCDVITKFEQQIHIYQIKFIENNYLYSQGKMMLDSVIYTQ